MILLAYLIKWWVQFRRWLADLRSRIGRPRRRKVRPTLTSNLPSFVQDDRDRLLLGLTQPHVLNHEEMEEIRREIRR